MPQPDKLDPLFVIINKVEAHKQGKPDAPKPTELEWVIYISYDYGRGPVSKECLKAACVELFAMLEKIKAIDGGA